MSKKPPSWTGFFLRFVAIAVIGIAILMLPAVDAALAVHVSDALATVCAQIVSIFGHKALAQGPSLFFAQGGGGVEIANGCNAIEACIILGAAIMAFPGDLKRRIIGTLIGILILQAINLLRIISLLYLSRYSPAWFEFVHLYLWDALMTFVVWARWHSRAGARAEAPPAAPAAA